MPSCVAFGCNNTAVNTRGLGIHFHRFPKDPVKLKAWARAVNRKYWTPTPHSRLCSSHFEEKYHHRLDDGSLRLIGSAVPTLFSFKKKSQLLDTPQCEQKKVTRSSCRKHSRREKRVQPRRTSVKSEQISNTDPPSSTNTPSDVPPPDPEPRNNGADPILQTEMQSSALDHSYVTTDTVENHPSVLTYFSYVPRVEPKPLLPIDHPYAVMESPVRLKRRCNDITDRLEECRRKLKMEQQKVRRWHRDVSRLKSTVKTLRRENAAPASCAQMVEENFSGVPKELVKRMLGEKKGPLEYDDELKAFANRLHLLSPKAYDYVRSSLKLALPHPRVMRLWRAQGKDSADGDSAQPEPSPGEEGDVRKNKDTQAKKGVVPLRARAMIQQCQYARLRVKPEEGDSFAEWVEIHKGMVLYICFLKGATEKLIPKMVNALLNVKLFEAEPSKQVSVLDLPGSVLIVPQDTLGGKAKRRSLQYPDNIDSWRGLQLYASFVAQLESQLLSSSRCAEAGVVVRYGVYGEQQALVLDSDGLNTHLMEF